MQGLSQRTFQVTYVGLVASLVLILPAQVGIGGSLGLVAFCLGLTAGLYLVREDIADVNPRGGYEPGAYLVITWVAPAVAAIVALYGLGTSPAELQALGGFVGLLGMANYFLRPVYWLIAMLFGVTGEDPEAA